MTIPIQWGLPQFILILVVILGVGLLISAFMELRGGRPEKEIFEDDQGHRYHRWRRRRRRLGWKRGTAGILMMAAAITILWLAVSIQSYLGLTSKIKVATVHAGPVANLPHAMNVELTQYDQNGKQISDQNYFVYGDRWVLQDDVIVMPSWLNIFGVHSGYKLTRLYGQYDDITMDQSAPRTVLALNGGDDSFFQSIRNKSWWSSSLAIEAAYGSAVIIPVGSSVSSYDVYATQTGLEAIPAS